VKVFESKGAGLGIQTLTEGAAIEEPIFRVLLGDFAAIATLEEAQVLRWTLHHVLKHHDNPKKRVKPGLKPCKRPGCPSLEDPRWGGYCDGCAP
jgi:hypothetical protein